MSEKKALNWIIAIIVAVFYLLVSIVFDSWTYSWLIWVVYAIYRLINKQQTVERNLGLARQEMIEKDDWRLLNDVEYLKNMYMNPTDGEEIIEHAPYLKRCIFCWDEVRDIRHQWWFVPIDMSCCICEECYNDFNEMFGWKKLDGWDIDWDQVWNQRNPK